MSFLQKADTKKMQGGLMQKNKKQKLPPSSLTYKNLE